MPEFAGTIPAVKERPKVAKRPTIAALPAPVRRLPAQKVAEPSPLAVSTLHVPVAEQAAVMKAEAKPVKRRTAIGTTIPAKKPLVAKKPRLLHGKTVARPAADAAPAQTVQLKREKDGELRLAAREEAQPVVEAKPHVKTANKAEEKSGASWISWLPIAAGIALGSVAPQLFAFAAHWNPWGLRVVFPYVQLCALHEIGMSDELTRTIPQLMLYLQFPLEGLLVASNLRRGARFAAAIGPVPGLHFVGGLVLWIVALGSMRPI